MTERIAADLRERRKQTAIELTSYLLHKHYCENDVESMIRLFDDRFSWMGAGEQEYAVGEKRSSEFSGSLQVRSPRAISRKRSTTPSNFPRMSFCVPEGCGSQATPLLRYICGFISAFP